MAYRSHPFLCFRSKMFLKAFRVKSNVQMKGSDKKKFKAELKKKFPTLSDADMASLLPDKEEVLCSKIYTANGDSVLLYIHNKSPLFFMLEKDKLIYPTVYTLWRFPDLLPTFPTWPAVCKNLANGADLMIPGIVVDQEKGIKAYLDGNLKKGDPVCINTVAEKSAFAVGSSYHSSEDMYMAGFRGRGFQVLHVFGDFLWQSGSRLLPPDAGPPSGLEFLGGKKSPDGEEGEDITKTFEVIEKMENVDLVEITDDILNKSDDDVKPEVKEEEPDEEVDPRSTQEIMDELLEHTFLQAWKTSATEKKTELPMLTSNFFRLHMVPQCPNGKTLDVKKSSHKKLTKFLAKMSKDGIIQVKELTKGVESITSVDRNHERILSHRVIKVVKEEEDEPAQEVLPCDRDYEPPVITELLTVNAAVMPFFKTLGYSKGKGFTPSEVRGVIVKYVGDNKLQKENKAMVGLDPVIAGIVLKKGENHVVELKWDELVSRMQEKMSPGYSMTFKGFQPQVGKGKLDSIELSVDTRSGNKKVTLVHNLDIFQINAADFARKVQVGVAASTSVQAAVNRRPGANEVLVQGNQTKYINRLLLETYKIPRKYVLIKEEKVKNKKKKK